MGNPKNTTALTDYRAIQKEMQSIEKLIDACDIHNLITLLAQIQPLKVVWTIVHLYMKLIAVILRFTHQCAIML